MIIIGDKYIPYENISKIDTIDDIKLSKPNRTIWFNFDKNIMQYCMQNDISYAVAINSIKESVYANSLDAKYILPSNNILESIQKIAENYMFDSKILAVIKDENEIEDIALKQIDGVIFKQIMDTNNG
ncbi:MAG: hypothetical protein U9R16_09730 [Campylobacterota bacterium]|nr:hypothetical protein [Campylobacterota bacterium]